MASPSPYGHRSATGGCHAGATTSSRKDIHAGVSPGPRKRFERDRRATAKPRTPTSREDDQRSAGGAAFGTGSADGSAPLLFGIPLGPNRFSKINKLELRSASKLRADQHVRVEARRICSSARSNRPTQCDAASSGTRPARLLTAGNAKPAANGGLFRSLLVSRSVSAPRGDPCMEHKCSDMVFAAWWGMDDRDRSPNDNRP